MTDTVAPENLPTPPLTPTEKVNAALDDRKVTMLPCNVCGEKDTFFLSEGYAVVALTPAGNTMALGGRGMPLLPLCCLKCGNTIFLSALLLGLGNNLFEGEASGGDK